MASFRSVLRGLAAGVGVRGDHGTGQVHAGRQFTPQSNQAPAQTSPHSTK
jgi:hypothetical protein